MCLWRCFLIWGETGLAPVCFEDLEIEGGGESEGVRRLFLSRSLSGDLRDDLEFTGDGERRNRGGDGVCGRFLCGERDLRLPRGDLLRDLIEDRRKNFI